MIAPELLTVAQIAGAFVGSAIGGFIAARAARRPERIELRRQTRALQRIEKRTGSDPPIDELDDPWPDILAEARKDKP